MRAFYYLCLSATAVGLFGIVTPAHAQERSAGNSVELQMTWTSLSNMINAANARTDALNKRVDQVVVCNKKFKLYAPGAAGADGDGCIDNQLIVQLTNRMTAAETTIADLNTRLTALDDKVTTNFNRIDSTITTLSAQLKALTTKVDSQDARITALDTRVTSMETTVNTLKTTVSNLDLAVTALGKRVTVTEGDIAAIKGSINTINGDISWLKGQVNTITANVNVVTANVNYILDCGTRGKVFNRNSGVCVLTEANIPDDPRWAYSALYSSDTKNGVISKMKAAGAPSACAGTQKMARKCSSAGTKCYIVDEYPAAVPNGYTGNHGDITYYDYTWTGTNLVCE